jgi:hypothetical protein
MSDFTGEQKLRIVLESLLRDVPKKDQCKKYGISESEFDAWNDKLIKDGGTIYETSSPEKFPTSRSDTSRWSKLVLIVSVLMNLLLVAGGIGWYFFFNSHSGSKEFLSNENTDLAKGPDSILTIPEKYDQVKPNPELDAKIRGQIKAKGEVSLSNDEKSTPIIGLRPVIGEVIPKVDSADLAREVRLMGDVYDGKHAVYVLDASLHLFEDVNNRKSFSDSITAIIESINSLSSYSFFNLVIYWDLREAAALGKTIVRASDENKKFATDWLSSLAGSPESVKENRSKFYPHELLYVKPMPGVVSNWYGLTMAISFEPDLIFLFTGNATPYDLSRIPYNHLSGLGIDPAKQQALSNNGGEAFYDQEAPDYIRKTAAHWLQSMEDDENLPIDFVKVEQLALERLGIAHGSKALSGMVEIPWRKTFENFLFNLDVNFDEIPQTHVFVNMPNHMAWPSTLTNSVKEFVESSKGTFTLNRLEP